MEKYNNFFKDITELVEKGFSTSKALKKEVENAVKYKLENIASELNLVKRDEFEIQKKLVEKLKNEIARLNSGNKKKKVNRRFKYCLSCFRNQ